MASIEKGASKLDQYRLGFQESMSETMQFLVEVEGFYAGDAIFVRLLNHLQSHCDKMMQCKCECLIFFSVGNFVLPIFVASSCAGDGSVSADEAKSSTESVSGTSGVVNSSSNDAEGESSGSSPKSSAPQNQLTTAGEGTKRKNTCSPRGGKH